MAYLGPALTAALGRPIDVVAALPSGASYPRPHVSFLKTAEPDGSAGLLVLKRYRDAAALEAETAALALARQAGLCVPDVLVAQTSADNPLGAPFVVMTRLAGRHLDEVPPDAAETPLRHVATVITRLHAAHAHASPLPCAPGRLEQGQDIDPRLLPDRLRFFAEVAAPYLRAQERNAAADLLAALRDRLLDGLRAQPDAPTHFTPTLLHGDLHVSNILVTDGDEVGLIDWGESCWGDAALELAYFHVRSLWLCFPSRADGVHNDLVDGHVDVLQDESFRSRTRFYQGAQLLALARRCAEWDRADLMDRLLPLLETLAAET